MKTPTRTFTLLATGICLSALACLHLWSCSLQTVRIGALLPLSGDAASMGQSMNAAIAIAVNDVNEYLLQNGAPFTLTVTEADTELDPNLALAGAQEMAAQGITLCIGPVSSAETAHLLEWANDNGTILFSQSTAPFLAIAEDNLFRLATDDSQQAAEIAQQMRSDGMQAVVPVYRLDVYATQLLNAAGRALGDGGDILASGVSYIHGADKLADVIAQLSDAVAEAVDEHGAGGAGVYLIGFEEGAEILALAKDDPILSTVAWYGSDSLALDSVLLENQAAAEFAADRGMVFPAFEADGEQDSAIVEEITNALGRPPETEALQAYDAVWIAALACRQVGPDAAAEKLRKIIPEVAAGYTGATGATTLNDAGDRAGGQYAFWQIAEENGTLQWVQQD